MNTRSNNGSVSAIAIFILLLGIAVLVTAVRGCFPGENKEYTELIQKLDSIEKGICRRIEQIDHATEMTDQTDSVISAKIDQVYKSLITIRHNQKKIQDEKLKNDLQIIIASDSSDWDFIHKQFPNQ